MNKRIKTSILALCLILGISLSVFAETNLSDLQKGVVDFSGSLAKTLPFNSSLGLNWADAYIGKLFPSAPPHFGVGGSFGFTTLELPMLNNLTEYLGYKLPFNMNKMFLPAYTVEARLGGIFLPFDVGVKLGYIPPVGLWGTSMNMNYLLAGADLRYPILDSKILPKISVGVGVNYLKAGIGGKVGSGQELSFPNPSDPGTPNTIALEQPEVNLKWDSMSIDFKAQISKSFLIITPYLGVGGSYAWSSAGYSVDSTVTYNGNSLSQDDITAIKDFLSSQGLDSMDVSSSGISSIIKHNAFNFRAFGGASLNLVVFRLDFTGLYSFLDNNFGASFGFRFQL